MTGEKSAGDSLARLLPVVWAVLAASLVMPIGGYLIIMMDLQFGPLLQLIAEDTIIANLYLAFAGEILGALFILLVLIPRLGVKRVENAPLTDTPTRETILWYFASVPLAIGVSLLAAMIYTTLGVSLESGYEGTLLLEAHHLYNPMNIMIFFAVGSIGAPLYEELLYRRLAIPMFERHGLPTKHAILTSTILFAAVHLPLDIFNGSLAGAITHFLAVFTIGTILGLVYVITRNVLFSVILHSIMNGASFALLVISISEPILGETSLILLIVAGMFELTVIFLGLIVLYQRYRQYRSTTPPPWVTVIKMPTAHRMTQGIFGGTMFFLMMITLVIVLENIILFLLDALILQIITILVVYLVIIVAMTWLATRAVSVTTNA